MSETSENNTLSESGACPGHSGSDESATEATTEGATEAGEVEQKRCWFFHLGRCRNEVCKFAHDEYLLTPQGAEAMRLETQARQRVVKALRRANGKLADEPLAIEKEVEPVESVESTESMVKPWIPRSKRAWYRRLSLCPYETEQRCKRPDCHLLHASKRYYYRVAVTQ